MMAHIQRNMPMAFDAEERDGANEKKSPIQRSKARKIMPTVKTIGSRWTSFSDSGYFL